MPSYMKIWSRDIKTFLMLNLAENEVYSVILLINVKKTHNRWYFKTISECFMQEKILLFAVFSFL